MINGCVKAQCYLRNLGWARSAFESQEGIAANSHKKE